MNYTREKRLSYKHGTPRKLDARPKWRWARRRKHYAYQCPKPNPYLRIKGGVTISKIMNFVVLPWQAAACLVNRETDRTFQEKGIITRSSQEELSAKLFDSQYVYKIIMEWHAALIVQQHIHVKNFNEMFYINLLISQIMKYLHLEKE